MQKTIIMLFSVFALLVLQSEAFGKDNYANRDGQPGTSAGTARHYLLARNDDHQRKGERDSEPMGCRKQPMATRDEDRYQSQYRRGKQGHHKRLGRTYYY